MNSKQERRAAAVAVSDDQVAESGVDWLKPGVWVCIHTADPIFHGRIVAMTPTHYFLEEASWVVETGRRSDFVANPRGVATEVEFIGRTAVERPVVNIEFVAKTGPLETK